MDRAKAMAHTGGKLKSDRKNPENEIDSVDLREVFPEMSGLSPRNVMNMSAFAEAWPELAIVQRVVAHIPFRLPQHHRSAP